MKIPKLLYLLFFTLFTSICVAQKQIIISNEDNIGRTYYGFDSFNNYYYTANNTFNKVSDTKTYHYQNISLGKISSIDIINPLMIVLFYEDFNTVVFLDNQLNEIEKIDFSKIDSSLVITKIGLAGQNKLWVYNQVNQRLLLFDTLNKTYKEMPIPIENSIVYTQSDFNNFYWVDDLKNFYKCDFFGKIELLSSLPSFDKIQIIDEKSLLFSKKNQLFLLNTSTKSISEIQIVEKSFENFYYKDQFLAIFTLQQISNYKIKIH